MTRLAVLVALAACADTTRTETVGDVEVTTIRRDYNNAHVVRAAGRTVLFDAALERHAGDVLDEVGGLDIDAVVVSHGHADHAGGASVVRDRTGAPVVMGAGDRFLTEQGQNDEICPTDGTAERRLEAAQAERFTPFEPDVTLAALASASLGDLLGWDEAVGTLHSVPGHTPGSVVLVVGDAVFAGDLLRGSVTGSAARTHYYMCDLDDNALDLRFLLDEVAPDGQRFFLGHFGPVDRDDVEALVADRS